MERLSNAQIVAGEAVGVELAGMLEDIARACEDPASPTRVGGMIEIDRYVLGPDDMDWAAVFRNFKEVVQESLKPRIVYTPGAAHAPHTPGQVDR